MPCYGNKRECQAFAKILQLLNALPGYLRATSSQTAHHSILQVTGVVAVR